jgi:hypothetical protein
VMGGWAGGWVGGWMHHVPPPPKPQVTAGPRWALCVFSCRRERQWRGGRTEEGGGLPIGSSYYTCAVDVAHQRGIGRDGRLGGLHESLSETARRGNMQISWEWFKLGAGLQGTPGSRAWHRNTGTTQVCVCVCMCACGGGWVGPGVQISAPGLEGQALRLAKLFRGS